MSSKNYVVEQNEFFNFILENTFFNDFKKEHPNKSLELFVSAKCNLKCEYCYLHKNGHLLYPPKYDEDEQIKNNLILLLKYFKENNFKVNRLSIFSGEILIKPLGLEILSILYDFISKYPNFCTAIVIPTNMCWIEDAHIVDTIEEYIEKFRELGIVLFTSASIDGKFLENINRKEKQKIRTEEFYKKIKEYAIKHHKNIGFHPMVASSGIEYWKENYDWWINFLKEIDFPLVGGGVFLEVRDNNWTEDKIKSYLDYIEYRFYYELKNIYNNNRQKYTERIFNFLDFRDASILLSEHRNSRTCSVQNTLTVRLGDLNIVPCHRMSYSGFSYGKFLFNNEKVYGTEFINPELALKILLDNPNSSSVECDTCVFNKLCLKGCFGSQYENAHEPLNNCNTVCNLFKEKIMLLIYLCEKNNMFDDEYIEKYYSDKFDKYLRIKKSCRNIKNTKEYRERYE